MVTVLQRTEGGRGAQRQVAQSSSSKRRPLSHTLVQPTRLGHLNSEKKGKNSHTLDVQTMLHCSLLFCDYEIYRDKGKWGT